METEETKQNSQQNEYTVQKENLPIHFQIIKNIELWKDKIFDCLSLEKTVTVLNINTYKIIYKIQLPTLCFAILAIPQYKNTLLVGTRAGNILIYENLHQFKGKLLASENQQAIFGLIQYKKSCQFFCYGKSGEVIHWDLKKREKIGVYHITVFNDAENFILNCGIQICYEVIYNQSSESDLNDRFNNNEKYSQTQENQNQIEIKLKYKRMSQDYANRHNFGYFSKTLTVPFQNYDHDIQTIAKYKKIHKFITASQKLEIMK
ncbi:WD40-repeat-containing domain [Pseudocohnilembus persalinus]|uniref:WD40-repeat-containing domain n=1 Tax=Pseudocohnilembus persalinus TaxID=266149 RepID=A0A0V0R5U3_PSEPJ|nr:WD40-repeat-containing domain [Pseudocohnilembus persalinus]|eukprot:KRX09728.1 WD40-repeat-containing domain [Pseudocohnilembus persalinus]